MKFVKQLCDEQDLPDLLRALPSLRFSWPQCQNHHLWSCVNTISGLV